MRFFLLIVSFCLYTSLYSQETCEWKIIQTNIDCLNPGQTTYTIEIMKDTVVNGKLYQKTSYKNQLFRETDGKVYCLSNEREYLLYDFTLEPDESFEIGNKSITVVCLQVMDTADQKKLMVEYSRHSQFGIEKETDIWIEGMGSCKHPFWIDFVFPNPGAWETKVLCFHRDNQLFYLNDFYSDCEIRETIQNIKEEPSIFLEQNTIYIKLPKDEPTLVKFFDLDGHLLLSKEIVSDIEISSKNIPNGMYIIKIEQQVNSYSYKVYNYGHE